MKVAFFASPAFALPVFEAIYKNFEIVLVVAQPDKPAGRGQKLTKPAIANRAIELNLLLSQPKKLKNNAEFAEILQNSGAEVAITCAYGKILPADLLKIPQYGFLNVHTSLLPKYRGAAPIQWALINGETVTGVTIMQTDPGLDTGPMLLQEEIAIDPAWTAIDLSAKLADIGANLIIQAIKNIKNLKPVPQNDDLATIAPLLAKKDGKIDWSKSAGEIFNRYRGLIAWPGMWFELENQIIKVPKLKLAEGFGQAGEILEKKNRLIVACGQGAIELDTVQPPTRPAMKAVDWFRNLDIKKFS